MQIAMAKNLSFIVKNKRSKSNMMMNIMRQNFKIKSSFRDRTKLNRCNFKVWIRFKTVKDTIWYKISIKLIQSNKWKILIKELDQRERIYRISTNRTQVKMQESLTKEFLSKETLFSKSVCINKAINLFLNNNTIMDLHMVTIQATEVNNMQIRSVMILTVLLHKVRQTKL